MTNKCTLPAICYEPLQTDEELARAEEETKVLSRASDLCGESASLTLRRLPSFENSNVPM